MSEIPFDMTVDIAEMLHSASEMFDSEGYAYHHVPEVGLIARSYDEDGNVADSWLVTFSARKYEITTGEASA